MNSEMDDSVTILASSCIREKDRIGMRVTIELCVAAILSFKLQLNKLLKLITIIVI